MMPSFDVLLFLCSILGVGGVVFYIIKQIKKASELERMKEKADEQSAIANKRRVEAEIMSKPSNGVNDDIRRL